MIGKYGSKGGGRTRTGEVGTWAGTIGSRGKGDSIHIVEFGRCKGQSAAQKGGAVGQSQGSGEEEHYSSLGPKGRCVYRKNSVEGNGKGPCNPRGGRITKD